MTRHKGFSTKVFLIQGGLPSLMQKQLPAPLFIMVQEELAQSFIVSTGM